MKLVLWDIDGTLVWTGGAGERALTFAMRDLFGKEVNMEEIDYSGRTDPMIARILFDCYGVEKSDANIDRFLQAYLENLGRELPRGDPSHTRVLPGVREIVQRLHEREDTVQGLLTGNLERGAETKLSFFELWNYFPFGAFADSSHDRNRLGPIALEAACQHTGEDFEPGAILVIGDTPHDIECARVIGARTLAVATGRHDPEQLDEMTPDWLFESLEEPNEILDIILS